MDSRTIYVEQMPPLADLQWVHSIFSEFGAIAYVSLPKFRGQSRNKGFAFVEFQDVDSAIKAVEVYPISSYWIVLKNNPFFSSTSMILLDLFCGWPRFTFVTDYPTIFWVFLLYLGVKTANYHLLLPSYWSIKCLSEKRIYVDLASFHFIIYQRNSFDHVFSQNVNLIIGFCMDLLLILIIMNWDGLFWQSYTATSLYSNLEADPSRLCSIQAFKTEYANLKKYM